MCRHIEYSMTRDRNELLIYIYRTNKRDYVSIEGIIHFKMVRPERGSAFIDAYVEKRKRYEKHNLEI